jgi:hypothetical protein
MYITSRREPFAAVTHHWQSDLSRDKLPKHAFLQLNMTMASKNGIKICSGNPKFF